jgi:hypothetical protein
MLKLYVLPNIDKIAYCVKILLNTDYPFFNQYIVVSLSKLKE